MMMRFGGLKPLITVMLLFMTVQHVQVQVWHIYSYKCIGCRWLMANDKYSYRYAYKE